MTFMETMCPCYTLMVILTSTGRLQLEKQSISFLQINLMRICATVCHGLLHSVETGLLTALMTTNAIMISKKATYGTSVQYCQIWPTTLPIFYYGLAERVGSINQVTNREAEVAISGPFGENNTLLLFTDGIVISSTSWNNANAEKRLAIENFIAYFVSQKLRENITLGRDLSPPQKRYLLQANVGVYSSEEIANDKIYQDMFASLQTAVPLPKTNYDELMSMEEKLVRDCMRLPLPPGHSPKRGPGRQDKSERPPDMPVRRPASRPIASQ